MASESSVIAIFEQHREIVNCIDDSNVSELINLDDHFRKIAVLSCASYLEADVTDRFLEYLRSKGFELAEFVKQHAVNRKFHTWFDWSQPVPNKFFKAWGGTVHKAYESRMQEDPEFNNCMRSFMRIVSERNNLVHNNLSERSSDLTLTEAREHFMSAKGFTQRALDLIRECEACH